MPSPAPFPPLQSSHFPALYLYPLNDSFVPKHITLQSGQRVKIGRQTNAKTVPGERNGYFDSKVLSRQHAEVWEEGGKIYIKDVKSSNGTFINGERLSLEGLESDPFELKTDDIVEFGIDIVGEDNKTIIHHKVAARVTCIITPEDAVAASRDAYNFQQQSHQSQAGPASGMNGNAQRRPTLQPQANGLTGLGGLGGGMRQPGKSGLTFDHILSRLQGELQKSRETGAELNVVVGSIGEIGDVMSGGQPANLPPYPHSLPPVRPPPQHPTQQPEAETSSSALQTLQSQLAETQASLSNHVEKIRTLETLLSEHEGIKREVSALRDLIEDRERRRDAARERMHDEDEEDDDDRRSVHTIVAHELESVPEEDENEAELEESDEERSARRGALGRPRTPEPSSLGMRDEDEEQEQDSDEGRIQLLAPPAPAIPDELSRRLSILSDQLESALELSRNLQVQHSMAQQNIEALEGKVGALEELVQASQSAKAAEDAKIAEREAQREKERENSMTAILAEFKKTIESRWDSVKGEWDAERERLDKTRGDWELRVKSVEDGLSSAVGKVDLGLSTLSSQLSGLTVNGHARVKEGGGRTGGLVTPPSPRSLSSDSDRPRRKRSASKRGRSKSLSPSVSTALVNGESGNEKFSSAASFNSRSSSPSTGHGTTDSESASPHNIVFPPTQFLPTPEASLLHAKTSADSTPGARKEQQALPVNNAQMAVGVFVLGVAAAAVLWRVKE